MFILVKNVIVYALRQLKVNEKNYSNYDLGFVAVVFALKIWLHYLYDVKSRVFTNHRSLYQVFTQKDLNLRQRRWMELLKDHKVTNVVVDDLSRKTLNMGNLAYLSVTKRSLAKEIQTLKSKFMQFCISKRGGVLANIEFKPTFIQEVKDNQLRMKI